MYIGGWAFGISEIRGILMPKKSDEAKNLRRAIVTALRRQGYDIHDGKIHIPDGLDKEGLRQMHRLAVTKKLQNTGPGVMQYEERLVEYIADGSELILESMAPKLVLVKPDTEEELLFRWTALHWSIPVSSGYGRRLRFLVIDQTNDKLMGVIGLGDPVYSIRSRDSWIGWDPEIKRERLYHIMDAFVMGSVPPYSYLLGGKLIAMLALSNKVRNEFRRKYADSKSFINGKHRKPFLVLLTTSSALGRSSVYNRLKVNGTCFWKSVGFTAGTGDFHFSNGVYDRIRAFAEEHCVPTAKQENWGKGFRNKREVIRKCLSAIGLSPELVNHGIRREVYVAPLGTDAIRFLRGEVGRPRYYNWSASDLTELFRERWLIDRANRRPHYKDFSRDEYRLWSKRK